MYKKWLVVKLVLIAAIFLICLPNAYAQTAKAYATVTVRIPERQSTTQIAKDQTDKKADKEEELAEEKSERIRVAKKQNEEEE